MNCQEVIMKRCDCNNKEIIISVNPISCEGIPENDNSFTTIIENGLDCEFCCNKKATLYRKLRR